MTSTSTPTARPAQGARALTGYRPFWAKRFGPAPFLPTSRAEMDLLGWDSCDVIIVTGDAYVDHPSFGMAVIGRTLEAQGFRVGILAQPDWNGPEAFRALGRPNLYFGVAAGNMDSMINHYTADRKIRSDDAYTPGGVAGKRPDRATLVYTQRCKEAFGDVPVIIGGIEASLRRIAHYDYWQEKVRRSVLVDSKADLLLYGNAERAIIEVTHRLAKREPIASITDVRGTAFIRRRDDPSAAGWFELDSTEVDRPGRIDEHINPYLMPEEAAQAQGESCARAEAAADAPTQPGAEAVGPPGAAAAVTALRATEAVVAMPVSRKAGRVTLLVEHTLADLHLRENDPAAAAPFAQAVLQRATTLRQKAPLLQALLSDEAKGRELLARIAALAGDGAVVERELAAALALLEQRFRGQDGVRERSDLAQLHATRAELRCEIGNMAGDDRERGRLYAAAADDLVVMLELLRPLAEAGKLPPYMQKNLAQATAQLEQLRQTAAELRR